MTDNRYTGQREEVEIGLYYYVARYYDPVLAHFIQADTLVPEAGNSLAYLRYAYVNFNPLIYIDPSGHVPNGCSATQDTGNCPVDWDNGGLDDGGDTDLDLTTNGEDQNELFKKFKKQHPGSTLYDFIAFQLGQEFANVISYDDFTCVYSKCRGLEGVEQEAMLIADLQASVVNDLFGYTSYRYGEGNLTENAILNWLGDAHQSAQGNADSGNISLEGQSEYGRYLGGEMAQAIYEYVNNGSEIHIYNNSPRSWGNQNQWNHTPRELGVTPLWEISRGITWYLLDNYGADIMFRDRK